MYQRKTRDIWEMYVNYGYGQGYEYELVEYTQKEIYRRVKEYRQNCPQYDVKVVKKRERILNNEK